MGKTGCDIERTVGPLFAPGNTGLFTLVGYIIDIGGVIIVFVAEDISTEAENVV